VIKIGVGEIPPLALLTLRFTLAGLLFLPFCKWPGWKQALTIFSVGILMGPLHQGFLYVGITDAPAGFMSILLQINVILVTLMGWIFFKESIGWRTWTGIAIGLIGVIILIGVPDENVKPVGYIYGLISAVFLALNYIGMKRIGAVHPVTYIVFLSLPTAPILLLSSITIEGTDWMTHANTLNWPVISAAVIYQAVILSISHIAWQKLMVEHPLSQLVPLTLTIPLFAVLIAMVTLGETLTPAIIIGGMLTISGVSLVTFRAIKKQSSAKD
jgi:O-acetylserine/cysteine efflux transporter